MHKLGKDDLQRRDDLVKQLSTTFVEIEAVVNEINELVTNKLTAVVEKYNNILGEVEEFRDDLVGQMEEYADERSDKWRESDKGSQYEEWKGTWENLDVGEIETPEELQVPEVSHADELEALETQPSE